jgi:recombination protein RecR
MLVEKDADLDNIEKSGVFKGRYFVLGGSIPILEKHPERLVRTRELTSRLEDLKKAKESPREIIFAFSNTPEGDSTAQFLIELLSPLADVQGFTFTTLGRGLSTGSELEYSDTETIKSAFQNRA